MAVAPIGGIAPFSDQLADRTRHKIALRLLPFFFILYVTNFLDRSSVAYAAIGMTRDLGFSDQVFGLGSGIFFISYVALQIPGALLVERWSARKTISASMLAWGSLTSLTALVHSPAQLYVARFALGAAEAGFFPGMIVYLSHWFVQKDRAKATGNIMAAIPTSYIIGSPIAGWILGKSWFALEGWRWLFILEGMPAIVLGIAAFFYLTDLPGEAKWLGTEQRQWIEEKLSAEKRTSTQAMPIRQALKSPTILWLAAACFLSYLPAYSFYFWFPTMLKRLSGFTDMRVGFLGALPYVAALFSMLINAWHSDKTGERYWHAAMPLLIAAAAYLGLIHRPESMVYSMLLFTMAGIALANVPVFWTIPTQLLSQSAAAAAVGMISAIGSTAGFAGPYLFGYLTTQTGSFKAGLTMITIVVLAGGLLMLSIPRNKKAVAA